ncbi:MAG: DMT family transporter [Symploca sp. SIO1B1]|nr:DMT family transporter [Symploca sp. SIO1C2]NER93250.1 DMT family transporter [Symploca sp. SIO1B1]
MTFFHESASGFNKYYLTLAIAIFLLSFAAVFIRLGEYELSPISITFNRYFLSGLILWSLRGLQILNTGESSTDKNITIDFFDILMITITGLLGPLTIFTWSWSLTQTNVANSNLLHNLTPVFSTLGGWAFLGFKFGNKFLIGLLISIFGASSIVLLDFQFSDQYFIGDGLAVLSSIFYAALYLVRERLRLKFPTDLLLRWQCLLSTMFILPILLITQDHLFPTSLRSWFAVIALAVFCQILGQGLLTQALQKFPSSFVTMLMLLEPILTVIWAHVFFSERITILNGLALLITLNGIYIAKRGQDISKDEPDRIVRAEQ